MSRVDVPTLKCDRCLRQTQDKMEMARFKTLIHYHQGASGKIEWDLCPDCFAAFDYFIIEGKLS